jgi:uncharacterized protein (TIGR04222 family)
VFDVPKSMPSRITGKLYSGPAPIGQVACAGLRAQGSVAVMPGHSGGATLHAGAPPPYADPVELAVFHAVSVGIRPGRLPEAVAVVATIRPCVGQLRRDDLLLTPRRRRAARLIGVVGGIGAVLVGTLVFFVGLALLFTPVSERPSVSRRAVLAGDPDLARALGLRQAQPASAGRD